jgi:hypothetical protein
VSAKNVEEVAFANIRGREVTVKNAEEVVFVNIRG